MPPGGVTRTAGTGAAPPPGGGGGGKDKLPLREGDVGLGYSRVRALPLFDDLTERVEGRLQGKGGRGAVVLRRFRAGEVICRQGEPGWTAFYLISNADLISMRQRQIAKADAADAQLSARATELSRLERDERLEPDERLRRVLEVERPVPEAEEAGPDDLLLASNGRPDPGEMEALLLEQEVLVAGDDADESLERLHPVLLELDIAGKLRRAEEIAGADEPLAALLRASARAAERRRRVEVIIQVAATATPAAPRGALERLRALVGSGQGGGRQPRYQRAAPAEQVIGTLGEGELFGELACLHHAPRAATVRAVRDCHVVELMGHVLRLLLDNKAFRESVDQTFRRRGLARLLRGMPALARAPDEAIELLRRRSQLLSSPPGAVVFDEGAAADSVYLVRTGTVKLVQRSAGGISERVLGYRSRGEVVGEEDFVAGGRHRFTCLAYDHPRDPAAQRPRVPVERRVELVRIDRGLWEELCAMAPAVGEEALRLAQPKSASAPVAETGAGRGASRIDELGLMQGRRLMLVDLARCTRCEDCVRACAEVQDDARPRIALSGPRIDGYLVPTSCRDCSDPVCLVGCPVGSIHQGGAGQIVIESWCIGCGLCAAQCPYGAIEVRPLAQAGDAVGEEAAGSHRDSSDKNRESPRSIAAVCDQCADVRGGPRCVSACAHDAAIRVDAHTFFAGSSSRGSA